MKETIIFCRVPSTGEERPCRVDTEDLQKILAVSHRWVVSPKGYAVFNKNVKGSCVTSHMHRIVTDCPPELFADHINGDKLDNRKANLRLVTNQQNCENRVALYKNNSSGYRGVDYHVRSSKWRAKFSRMGKQVHVGFFDTAEEANEAVKKARAANMPFSSDAREAAFSS